MYTDLSSEDAARALAIDHCIETDLRTPQQSIVVAMIADRRGHAINSLRALADVDPFDPNEIMRLQNEVRHFRAMTTWLLNQQVLAANAFAQLSPEEQAEVIAYTQQDRKINDA